MTNKEVPNAGEKDFSKVRERIKTLLAKAADTGCSESEAAGCMAKARKLMAEYDLTEAELLDESVEHEFVTQTEQGRQTRKGRAFHPVDRYMGGAIGRFCGVIKYWEDVGGRSVIRYFGRAVDVEYARWMREAFIAQGDREWEAYKVARKVRRTSALIEARKSFFREFCKAVIARLDEWTFDKDGTALAVVKFDLVCNELQDRGIFLGPVQGGRMAQYPGDKAAAAFGRSAGNRADIGRATSANPTLSITAQ